MTAAHPIVREAGARPRLPPEPTPAVPPLRLDRRADPAASRLRLGIGAMLLSTLLFPLSDTLSKAMAQTYSGVEITWMRYVVLLAVIAPTILRRPALLRTARPLVQVGRGVASATATSLALVGFMFLPVANATAIGFCAPLFVTLLAAVVLKETVGLPRWFAAAIGFAGILIIVQPGKGTFQAAALLPLASSLFSALTVITTRLGRTERVETTVVWSALVGFIVTSVAVAFCWRGIDGHAAGLGLVMGVLAATASILQVIAYRCAPASLIAPFSYAQILWAIGIGWFATGLVPGLAMLAGSAVVILSGCGVAWHERRTAAKPRAHNWRALRHDLARLDPANRRAA